MKSQTETPAKSFIAVGSVIGSILLTAAADTREKGKRFSSTLTTDVGGFTYLRVQDGKTTLKLKLVVPPAGKKTDYRSTVVHGARIEVSKSKFDQIDAELQQKLAAAGIGPDQIVDMVESTTGYPLATMGDTGTKIAALLSDVQITQVAADSPDQITAIAPDIIEEIVSIFAHKSTSDAGKKPKTEFVPHSAEGNLPKQAAG